MSVVFIYVTSSSEEEAEAIAASVVRDRLAACANIIRGMTSVYEWQGKLQRRGETVIIFKTRETLFEAVEAKVKELHSDETPCIVALPVSAGRAAFLDWVIAETAP